MSEKDKQSKTEIEDATRLETIMSEGFKAVHAGMEASEKRVTGRMDTMQSDLLDRIIDNATDIGGNKQAIEEVKDAPIKKARWINTMIGTAGVMGGGIITFIVTQFENFKSLFTK